jgi:hypothetical protein
MNVICNSVTGQSVSGASGALADNPHFIWDGTAWALSSAAEADVQNLSCSV